MFETAFALGLTQFARSLSFPERLSRRPVRNAALEPWRLRNTGFDALYYDVKALTAEETFYVSDCLASEGMIMIVPPSGHGMLTLCDSVEEFRLRGGREVQAMAVAGIGGSAIGAAAFARNVADAVGSPVAAVVSGYGLGDIVNEAIGGAFLFGWMGHVRGNLEAIDDAVGRPKVGAYSRRESEQDTTARSTGLDSDTVLSLLEDSQLNFTFIAGHSRGNRVIADALYALKRNAPDRLAALAATCRVVTFGGRIKMPELFAEVVDVVGEFDWFGELNSRPKIPTDIKVPFCGHSTNTDIPGSLQVKKILTGILAEAGQKPVAEQALAPESEADTTPAVTSEKAAVTPELVASGDTGSPDLTPVEAISAPMPMETPDEPTMVAADEPDFAAEALPPLTETASAPSAAEETAAPEDASVLATDTVTQEEPVAAAAEAFEEAPLEPVATPEPPAPKNIRQPQLVSGRPGVKPARRGR